MRISTCKSWKKFIPQLKSCQKFACDKIFSRFACKNSHITRCMYMWKNLKKIKKIFSSFLLSMIGMRTIKWVPWAGPQLCSIPSTPSWKSSCLIVFLYDQEKMDSVFVLLCLYCRWLVWAFWSICSLLKRWRMKKEGEKHWQDPENMVVMLVVWVSLHEEKERVK